MALEESGHLPIPHSRRLAEKKSRPMKKYLFFIFNHLADLPSYSLSTPCYL
jgi:hypothetical protein